MITNKCSPCIALLLRWSSIRAPKGCCYLMRRLCRLGSGLTAPFNRFAKSNVANAAIEFGLAMPILMLLALGGFEMTRFIIIQQKISKTVTTMGDLVARSPSLAASDITNMFNAVDHLMAPYQFGANGRVILSNVSNNGATVKVNWQRFGGGTYSAVSKIGAQNAVASLPAGFTLDVNEDTIVSEIYYNYRPLVAPNIIAAQVVYKVKYYKPRLGALTVINP